MSKKVDYNAMRACMAASNSMISQWNSNIFTVMEKAGRIIVGNNISGNKADRMKEYLSTVYQCVDAAFSVLMKTFSGNFLVYVSKDYPGIDGALNTVIDEAELQDRYSSIMQKRTELQNTATSAENAIQRVSDLVLLPKPDFDDADAEIDSWDIQEGDYEYGEFYGGQINLCERTPNNYRNILHADFARDIKTKRTALDEMSFGEDAFDFEKELAVKLNCMRKL